MTIQGGNFDAASQVRFGSAKAASFTVVSPAQIQAVSPPGSAGSVDVTITNSGGSSAKGGSDRFTYMPPTPTTTSATTTTSTSTTTTGTTAAHNPLVARIVYAIVAGQGKHRLLDVRIRVSERATAQLQLFGKGKVVLRKRFAVKPGANELRAPAAGLRKGVYRLKITLQDASRHRRLYTATVRAPA